MALEGQLAHQTLAQGFTLFNDENAALFWGRAILVRRRLRNMTTDNRQCVSNMQARFHTRGSVLRRY